MTRTSWWAASGSAALLLALGGLGAKAIPEIPGANRPTTSWKVQGCEYTATTWGREDGDPGSYNGAVEYFGSEKAFTDKMPWFGDYNLATTFSREEGGLVSGGVMFADFAYKVNDADVFFVYGEGQYIPLGVKMKIISTI